MNSTFGPYDISRELGRGAMGVVYLAVHRSLQRQCALKTIALKFKDPLAAERFILEGQSVARLGKHPNIVQVFDAGIVENTPYIAMEFIEGDSLDSILERRGPLSETDAVEFARKIALALDHAHRRGIVHRDVKPANIIVDHNNEPYLLDFGIAKTVDAAQQSGASRASAPALQAAVMPSKFDATTEATFIVGGNSSTGSLEQGIQGTPSFMAPEQADPQRGPVDARSDVYALGATLYALTTGQRPFQAATITALLVQVVTQPPPPPGTLAVISPDLEAVMLKALEKDPTARYQTALEFADDLSRVTMGLPTRARKLGKLGWIWRRARAYARLLAIAGLSLLFAGFLLTYFLFRSREIQALWEDIAERTARATAQEVRSLLDPALPMLRECCSLAEAGLLPVDDQELLARHLVARFRYQQKLSWLSYGNAQGAFTGAWRSPAGRIAIQRSWLDEQGGHVREEFVDGDLERLRWNDDWKYDPRTRPFYQLAASSPQPVWTEPYEWFGEEGLGITAAFCLRDPDSQAVRGVFTADYHLGTLSDFLANLRIGKQGRAYLLEPNGNLLASPDRGAVAADPLLTAALQHSESAIPGGIDMLTIDEPRSFMFRHERVAYVAAVEAFQPAENLPIVTIVLVPEDDIIGPVRETAVRTAKIAGSIALFAVAISVIATINEKRRLLQAVSRKKRHRKPKPSDPSNEKTSIVTNVGTTSTKSDS